MKVKYEQAFSIHSYDVFQSYSGRMSGEINIKKKQLLECLEL
jgi:hypothetical protein